MHQRESLLIMIKLSHFYDRDDNENTGRVKCLEKYCRFYSLPISSNYKFNLRYDGTLYHSHESSHFGVEYDVTYRSIIYVRDVN